MLKNVLANAWGFTEDTENLFPGRPLLEEMGDASEGQMDVQPKKILRDRQYGESSPLIVMPEYKGDFLDKLREQYKNRSADCLLDFSGPDDMLKYIPETQPRDLTDEFYEFNRPNTGENDTLKDYDDRSWDEDDAPEISEDKILRMRDWDIKNRKPKEPSEKHVVNAFLLQDAQVRARTVVANFLMALLPSAYEIDLQQRRVAKVLNDFQRSLIYTKEKGWRKPDGLGVSVRLLRAEPRASRWTFLTTSGEGSYNTVFQFIPQGSVKDPNKLNVRVSCTCPSWLFWGAQYNAVMEDYLYGRVRPKFTPPSKRDPTGRFLVCKHVLACIPIVSKYKIAPASTSLKDRLKKTPKIQIEKNVPKEKLRIPDELKNFARRDDIRDAVKSWPNMPDNKRSDFIMGLDTPGAVSFMAHRFPDTATEFVVKKLKEMAVKHPLPSMRVLARKLLREII